MKNFNQTKNKLIISISILTLIIALPLLIAYLYQPTHAKLEPRVAGAQTDLNQDGQVDILDYTIQTSLE